MKGKIILATLCASVMLQACKQEESFYTPSIKAISFAAFSAGGAELNQTFRTITLTMPTSVTDLTLKSTIELSPNTEITDGLLPDGTLDLSDYCPCSKTGVAVPGQLAKTIRLRNTVDNGSGTYLLLLKSKNPLLLKSLATPIIVSLDKSSRIYLPAENYYGNPGVYGISLAPAGSVDYKFIHADGGCMSICDQSGQHPNQVGISLDAYIPFHLKPGQYDLRLQLEGGSVLKYPLPITVN